MLDENELMSHEYFTAFKQALSRHPKVDINDTYKIVSLNNNSFSSLEERLGFCLFANACFEKYLELVLHIL